MAVGDALALLVSRMRDFSPEDFALYHPAGSLGRKLTRVEDVMRTGKQLPPGPRRARPSARSSSGWPARAGAPGRCSSRTTRATSLGIFTDSDLARLFEKRREADLDRPIGEVMTAEPQAGPRRLDAQRRRRAHEDATRSASCRSSTGATTSWA